MRGERNKRGNGPAPGELLDQKARQSRMTGGGLEGGWGNWSTAGYRKEPTSDTDL